MIFHPNYGVTVINEDEMILHLFASQPCDPVVAVPATVTDPVATADDGKPISAVDVVAAQTVSSDSDSDDGGGATVDHKALHKQLCQKAELSRAKSTLTSRQTKLDALNAQLSKHKKTMDDNTTDVSTIQTKLDKANAALDEASKASDTAAIAKWTAEVHTLDARLKRERDVEPAKLQKQHKELEDRIEKQEGRVKKAQESVDGIQAKHAKAAAAAAAQ